MSEHSVLEEVSERQSSGDETRWVEVHGTRALVQVSWDADEVRRRRQSGLQSVTCRATLELLSTLPAGVAVPADLLGERELLLLSRMSCSIVARHADCVEALLKPVLTLRSVGVLATNWKRGLEYLRPFASHCARYVVIEASRSASTVDWVQAQARFLGMGLATMGSERLEWLVDPATFSADRFTSAAWLLTERLADQLGLPTSDSSS